MRQKWHKLKQNVMVHDYTSLILLLRKKGHASSRVFTTIIQSIHRDVQRPSCGISRYDFPSGYEEEFEGSSRFSRPGQATSCITILLQFPEQKLRDTFHHDVTGTKLFLSPRRLARFSLPQALVFLV